MMKVIVIMMMQDEQNGIFSCFPWCRSIEFTRGSKINYGSYEHQQM